MYELDLGETTLRLAIALAAGAAIGWEREWRRKPAGLRTNALVSLAAAAFTIAGLEMTAGAREADATLPVDPLRVIPAVAIGIGFVGAGSIIRDHGSIAGLTTAGGLWVAGAVGIACGAGLLAIAAVTAGLALVALTIFRTVEERVFESGEGSAPGPKD